MSSSFQGTDIVVKGCGRRKMVNLMRSGKQRWGRAQMWRWSVTR